VCISMWASIQITILWSDVSFAEGLNGETHQGGEIVPVTGQQSGSILATYKVIVDQGEN
jgi:hypothetical protein